MLHLNELPFRHLFDAIDGKTTGPTTFAGEIGKQIKKAVHQLSPVSFQPISGDLRQLSPDIVKDLSADQRYLYEICQAVSTGKVSKELSTRSPGILHHARWLTRANRILRLHVSTSNPSRNLKELVKVVMFLYAPGWFHIKSHPSVSDGAQNLWYILSLSRQLKEEHQAIVASCLSNNAIFAHSDNLLVAMLNAKMCDGEHST